MEQARAGRRWLWVMVAAVVVIVVAGGFVVRALSRSSAPEPSTGTVSGETLGRIPTSTVKPVADPAIAKADVATQTAEGRWVTVPKAGEKPRDLEATFKLRVFWWNDTKARPAHSFELGWGSNGSWKADGTKSSQVTEIGPFPTGVRFELGVFPSGTSGDGWAAPLYISPQMISASDQDALHVEITDDGMKVLGNPVQNFEVDFPRP